MPGFSCTLTGGQQEVAGCGILTHASDHEFASLAILLTVENNRLLNTLLVDPKCSTFRDQRDPASKPLVCHVSAEHLHGNSLGQFVGVIFHYFEIHSPVIQPARDRADVTRVAGGLGIKTREPLAGILVQGRNILPDRREFLSGRTKLLLQSRQLRVIGILLGFKLG